MGQLKFNLYGVPTEAKMSDATTDPEGRTAASDHIASNSAEAAPWV
jgi:hypothetical protein